MIVMDSKKMTNVNVRNLSKALGNFDGVFGQHLSGWYLHKGSNQAAQLSVYVNGELFETVSCDRNRPDVQSNLGYGRKSGFFVDLSKLPSGKVHQITMLDEQYGFDFNGLSIAFSGDVAGYADKLREIFVADYYIQKNKLLHVKLNQAFEHYISRGVYQGFSPCPWFDQEFVLSQIKDDDVLSSPAVVEYLKREQELKLKPCEVFDPAAYLRSNPDLSKNMCLLGHYVKHGRFEGRKLGSEELPQSIIDELIELSAIEPKLNTVIDKTGFVVRYSMNGPGTFVAAMHESIYGKNIDAIVCVPFISIGGADLVATHVVRAYQEVYGADRVLLMVTDASSVELPQWLGKDTKVSLIGKDLAGCDPSRRVEVLHNTIARLNPKKLFNIN